MVRPSPSWLTWLLVAVLGLAGLGLAAALVTGRSEDVEPVLELLLVDLGLLSLVRWPVRRGGTRVAARSAPRPRRRLVADPPSVAG